MLRSRTHHLNFRPALAAITMLSSALLLFPITLSCVAQEPQSVLDGPIVGQTNLPQPTPSADPIPPANDLVKDNTPKDVVDAGDDIDELITSLVLKNIPHQFNEDKDWGKQESRWDGVKIRRDGLKLRTHRKTKMVNHGTWRKYEVSLMNPKDQFSISVKNMREVEDGKMAFDVHVAANLKIDGRQAKWTKGVQLYNVSIDGKTRVKLMTTIELRTLMNITKFPPELVFRPEATAADISVEDFRIDRISKLGGEVSQQVSRVAQQSIESRIEKEEAKIVKKLNKEFEKNADKLKLSLNEAMSSKWASVAQKLMPADAKEAMEN